MQQYRCSSFCSFYKGQKFIEGYIKNMLEQSIFNDIEFIFLDCASPENEKEYILPLTKKYPNIKYYRLNKDPGLYAGWNEAIKKCSSDIVTNWNIDDRKSKDGLEILVSELENDKTTDMIYGLTYVSHIANETYEDNSKKEIFKCHDHSFAKLIKHNSPHCMPMWRKQIHDKCGLFNEKYQSISDAEMWLRLCVRDGVIKHVAKPVGLYYWNPKGRSTDETFADQNHKDLQEAKIKILTDMSDIENLLPPIDEYKPLYYYQNMKGQLYAQASKNLLISVIHNTYKINVKKIHQLLSIFNDTKLVIYEITNNSTMSKELVSLINTNSQISGFILNTNNPYQYILNKHKKDFIEYDFVTFFDVCCIDISINGVYNTFGYLSDTNNNIKVISGFNIQKEIYDKVNRLFLINKNASSYRFNFWSEPEEISKDYIYDLSFSYRMYSPTVGSPPTPVYSNYGGYITYRASELSDLIVRENHDAFVEINKQIYLKNPKNYSCLINPSQIMLSYYETE